jgi:formylglycine-generating enzyme required for sulfatase activity
VSHLKTSEIKIITITQENNSLKEKHTPGQVRYVTLDIGNGVAINMAVIPEGSFKMGSPEDEEGRNKDESPQHQVNLAAFLMGVYPVTQAQWQAVMGDNPSHFQGANRPVERVSWYEAMAFCRQVSQITGRTFRLPGEAQWEYACRAGTNTPFHFGATLTEKLANYNGNYTYGIGVKGIYRHETTEVGSFSPNAFGLYDMHGNVLEWCEDSWHESYEGAPKDGSSWGGDNTDSSQAKIVRGGGWDATTWYCRSAVRLWTLPDVKGSMIGFRVVCD